MPRKIVFRFYSGILVLFPLDPLFLPSVRGGGGKETMRNVKTEVDGTTRW